MGRPSARPRSPVTVQENKRAQVRYPGEGKLEGSSVSWDRIAEGCQRPVRCSLCNGTGEITAERLLQLLGRKRPHARNRHGPKNSPSTEELAAIIDGHAAEVCPKTSHSVPIQATEVEVLTELPGGERALPRGSSSQN
jgi:hypothetical protein